MGYSIPIIFLPIKKREQPRKLRSWEDGINLLNRYYEVRDKVGLRISTSRNWWLKEFLDETCKALNISDLEFIREEITVLDTNKLTKAIRAVDALIQQMTSSKLAISAKTINEIWGFDGEIANSNHAELFTKAFYEAEAFYDSYATDGFFTYKGVVDFFSFIKTLRLTMQEALEQDKYLLVVQPQP